jgi:hypothetical protein
MRLYGRRFAGRYIDKRVEGRAETRDAVLWDLDEANYQARVKIQGSNELVIAHYPRNWKRRPYWLKPNNAVRILHRSGVRGYVEIIGEGRAIPTPVSGDALPPPSSTLPDEILYGLEVTPAEPPSMGVLVSAGAFRMDGVIYYVFPESMDEIIMNDPPPMIMGSMTVMGGGIITVALNAAPAAGYYRYDLLVVGKDSVIDYIPGTPSKTSPVKPVVPADHLQIGDYIIVGWNDTVITGINIGAVFSIPVPTRLTVSVSSKTAGLIDADGNFAWCDEITCGDYPNPECYVTVAVVDQYGVTLSNPGLWRLSLELDQGTGQVWSSETGYADTVYADSASSYHFVYQRDQSGAEVSVVLKATLYRSTNIEAWAMIVLLDISGEPV